MDWMARKLTSVLMQMRNLRLRQMRKKPQPQQIGNTNTTKCDLIIFSLNGVDSTLVLSHKFVVLMFGDIFQNDHNDLKAFREELQWGEEVEYSYSVKGMTRDFAFPKGTRFFCINSIISINIS